MTNDLSFLRWWSALVAVALVVNLVAMAVAAVALTRLARRAGSILDWLERDGPPLLAQAKTAVTEARDTLEGLRRVETRVDVALTRVNDGVARVQDATRRTTLPALAIWNGARAAWRAFRRPRTIPGALVGR